MKEDWAKKYLNEHTDRCWFCQQGKCDEFDMEFDTFLHIECLKKAVEKDPNDPEASLMAYLLEEEK